MAGCRIQHPQTGTEIPLGGCGGSSVANSWFPKEEINLHGHHKTLPGKSSLIPTFVVEAKKKLAFGTLNPKIEIQLKALGWERMAISAPECLQGSEAFNRAFLFCGKDSWWRLSSCLQCVLGPQFSRAEATRCVTACWCDWWGAHSHKSSLSSLPATGEKQRAPGSSVRGTLGNRCLTSICFSSLTIEFILIFT